MGKLSLQSGIYNIPPGIYDVELEGTHFLMKRADKWLLFTTYTDGISVANFNEVSVEFRVKSKVLNIVDGVLQ